MQHKLVLWLVLLTAGFLTGFLLQYASLQRAQEEMTQRLKPEVNNYPEEHKGHESVTVYPLWRNPFGLNEVRQSGRVLLGRDGNALE